jgi:hypothetical protein
MAIAVDATSEHFTAAGTTDTSSHTCTGTDRALIVSIFKYGGGDSVTGVTYAGVSMTQLGKVSSDASGYTYLYGLANPASGANNIVCTSSSSVQWFITAASYTGVDQTTPFPDTGVATSSTNSSFSISMTTTVDQSWLVMAGRSPSKAPTAGSGTVVRKLNVASGDAGWTLDSNGGLSTGSNALAWSYTGSSTSYYVMEAIAPAGGGGATFTPRTSFFM